MRIRTMAGLAVAGTAAAAAIAGGVAYAAADEEPIVRIVEQEAPAENAAAQPEEQDCPEKNSTQPSQAGL